MTEKEEIASTEFPEGGDTIYTKGPPASPRGEGRRRRGKKETIKQRNKVRNRNMIIIKIDRGYKVIIPGYFLAPKEWPFDVA